MKRILVFSPHPDDAEMGCGATLWRLVKSGADVVHVLFTASENIGRKSIGKHTRKIEFQDANTVLGISQTKVYDYPHRRLHSYRQDVLQNMIDIRDEYMPDAVFVPCLDDMHQDHKVVAEEAFRAFKKTDLMGYEILWNNLNFQSQAFSVISEQDVRQKWLALFQYKSQHQDRHYFDAQFVYGLARVRGAQIGAEYAECFANYRRICRL